MAHHTPQWRIDMAQLRAENETLRAENELLAAWATEERNKVHKFASENERLRVAMHKASEHLEWGRAEAAHDAIDMALADQGKG